MGREKTDFCGKVRKALKGLPRRDFRHESIGDAAVHIVLNSPDVPAEILLTRRSLSVSTHKGEVAFPGGRKDSGDKSLLETALRETHEEVGIPPDKCEVVGRMNDYLSVTRWKVTPFVSFLTERCQLQIDPAEVDRAFWVPLRFFRENNPRIEKRLRLGRTSPVYFYDYEEEVIWGMTARILHDLLPALSRTASYDDR
jgi:8-oxo-dGTP pyrophosphatase MutT (NUDIX family)